MAGTSSKADEGKKKARIEIIPLIDVIFFLLATFVLFTLSLNKIASVPVDLPVANPNPKPPDPNDPTVFLEVSEQDNVFWRQGLRNAPELISIGEIRSRLGEYKQRLGNDARVLVQGDNGAKFGAAVRALDEIRRANIDQVSIQTTVQPTGR
jgi:biopolymer transport protein ExbD